MNVDVCLQTVVCTINYAPIELRGLRKTVRNFQIYAVTGCLFILNVCSLGTPNRKTLFGSRWRAIFNQVIVMCRL